MGKGKCINGCSFVPPFSISLEHIFMQFVLWKFHKCTWCIFLVIRSSIFFPSCQVYSIQNNFQRQGYLILSSRGCPSHSSDKGREQLPFWAFWTSSHLVAVTIPFWNRRARRELVLKDCHLIKEPRSLTVLLFEILWRHSFGFFEDSPMNKSGDYGPRVAGL